MIADADATRVALRVAQLFESLGLRYTIGSSIASSIAGELDREYLFRNAEVLGVTDLLTRALDTGCWRLA